ncbi:MAG: amidase [Clostridium sp.]|nr:amidase [Clostridium sp.]
MKLSEYSKLDATALAALIRQKEISPKEALDTALEALRQVNGRLNAVVDYTYDYGLKQIDKGIDYEAPFCGVPFVLKDCGGEAAGIRATMGTRLTGKGVYAGEDSTLFKRMKKAGVIVAATAATSELCIDSSTETIRNGPTRNPWNTEFSPGGSSGGSAALVAAGAVPMAHGSDGGGSIRIPASMCGIVGFKPSRFRVPTGPFGWDPGGSVSFVLTRSVRDSAAMLDAVEGPDSGYYGTSASHDLAYREAVEREPGKLKIAYMLRTPYGKEFADPECAGAVLETVELLRSLGHVCVEDYPEIRESYQEARIASMCDEIAVSIEELAAQTGLPVDETTLEPLVYKTYLESAKRPGMDVFRARAELGLAARRVGTFFERYDIIVSPAVGKVRRRLGTLNGAVHPELSASGWAVLRREYACITPLANIAGLPSISLPLYMTEDNMPLGIELDGAIDNDQTVLSLAAQLERARPWIGKIPPVYVG